jgi:hypothetical protein
VTGDGETAPTTAPEPAASEGWLRRRRARMIAEIERNRRGGHRVPTWALALALAALLAAWAAVIILA